MTGDFEKVAKIIALGTVCAVLAYQILSPYSLCTFFSGVENPFFNCARAIYVNPNR